MSNIVVTKVTPKPLPSGKTKYSCIGTIDGEIETFDMWNSPTIGEEFEANVKDDPKWGKTVFTGQPGGQGGRSFGRSPETDRQIIRQNALTNAVNYVIGKSQHMTPEEAKKFISGKEVIQVATYFARFSLGEITVVSEKQENTPLPTPPEEEIDLSDLDFSE